MLIDYSDWAGKSRKKSWAVIIIKEGKEEGKEKGGPECLPGF
jgi:hypothetical protein